MLLLDYSHNTCLIFFVGVKIESEYVKFGHFK